MRVIAVLCAFAFLVVPAQASERSDEYTGIHTVGVISAIGDSLELKTIGVMIFGNSLNHLPITSWGLDSAVVQQVTDAVSTRFTVKPVTADPTTLETFKPGFFVFSGVPDVGDYVRALPADNGVDAYIIIRKTLGQDPFFDTNQYLWGLGVLRRANLSGFGEAGIYGFFEVDVVDAKSGHIIDSGVARAPGATLLDPRFPWIDIPQSDWPDSPENITDEQTADIKKQAFFLVRQTLPVALRAAGLAQAATGTPPIKPAAPPGSQ